MELYRRKKSKYWYVDIGVGPNRVRRSLKTTDKFVARSKARTLENEIINKGVPATHLSMQEFITRYFNSLENRVRKKTIQARRNALNNLLEFHQFSSPSQITVAKADEFLSWLLKKPIKSDKITEKPIFMRPVSANSNIRNLRQIWNWAIKTGYSNENVWQSVRLVKVQQQEVRILSKQEIRKMLKSADALYPDRSDLFRFYLLTGMRLNEALNLEWSDIDFLENEIFIGRSTKAKYNRKVMMLPKTEKILKARKNLHKPFPYEDRRLKRIYKRIIEHSGIQYTSIQDLRATCYSFLVSLNVPQQLIRKIIGHTGDRIGQIHYFNMPTKDVMNFTRGLSKIIG